jgi:hypothetical protein
LRIELQRLVFRNFGKKSPGGCRGFFVGFAGVFEGGFRKSVFSDWFFVVKLWWIRGELWSVGDGSVAG